MRSGEAVLDISQLNGCYKCEEIEKKAHVVRYVTSDGVSI